MTDGNSVKAITGEVRRLDGISGVEIDLHTGWVVIAGQSIDSEAIRRAVSDAGYEAQL
jgi:copper chaperone